jgi:hypothetical protein
MIDRDAGLDDRRAMIRSPGQAADTPDAECQAVGAAGAAPAAITDQFWASAFRENFDLRQMPLLSVTHGMEWLKDRAPLDAAVAEWGRQLVRAFSEETDRQMMDRNPFARFRECADG